MHIKIWRAFFFGGLIMLGALLINPSAAMTAGAPEKSREQTQMDGSVKILFLHHSTGGRIWKAGVLQWFEDYNNKHGTTYLIQEQQFPKSAPYGWKNFPFDYWNIWVEHAGDSLYKGEPTLEILCREYDVIIFKHCFPVCNIKPDKGRPDIASEEKRIENYMLQYNALKNKMHEFPDTRFIVWTGAALVKFTFRQRLVAFLKRRLSRKKACQRAKKFFDWVVNLWDEPEDNIYLWDFFQLEAEGGIYLKRKYAASKTDSHPNATFSKKSVPLLCQRIVGIIRGEGDNLSRTGE